MTGRRSRAALAAIAATVCAACDTLGALNEHRAPLALAPLPDHRHGHRVEVLDDGRVLLFGGYEESDIRNERGPRSSWLFDPSTAAWHRTGDLAIPLVFHASAELDGVVYAVGAHGVQRFDVEHESWNVVLTDARLPTTHGGAAIQGRVLVAEGGFTAVAVDLDTNELRALPALPAEHPKDSYAYVATIDGRVHILGRLDGATFQPQARHFVLGESGWLPRAPMPEPDAAKFGVGVAVGEQWYLFGAGGSAVYDARSDSWEALPPAPWRSQRALAAACAREGYVYLVGGLLDGSRGDVDVFDTANRRWLELADRSPPKAP